MHYSNMIRMFFNSGRGSEISLYKVKIDTKNDY